MYIGFSMLPPHPLPRSISARANAVLGCASTLVCTFNIGLPNVEQK
jgi:hypothetical protein